MSPTKLYFGALCLSLAPVVGCAAQNGGGHVVGNPIISESASKTMKDPTCDCASSKDAKVKATCKCATDTSTSTSTSTKTCKDGDKSCSK